MRRTLWLYRRCLGAHIRAALEYEADFWLLVVASVLVQVVGIVFLSAVFAQVPTIDGWTFPEVVLIFSLVVIAEGVGSLFFEGAWDLPWYVNQGQLDYDLVRPYPVVLQVMSSAVGLNGAGNLVSGGSLLGWALWHAHLDWNPVRFLAAAVLFASAILIKLSINLASNCAPFWLLSPTFQFGFALHQVGDLARYPLSVYATAVKLTLTAVVPFAFISYFPASAVLGHGDHAWLGFLTPVVAAYCLVMAGWIFHRGLRRYESAGS